LRHGAKLPALGLGTWPLDDRAAERVVAEAVGLGYRLIDTAENYGNERGVGAGLRAAGVAREDVFVTTKLNVRWHGRELVREALAGSLERLRTDYVDLLLIHWPNPAQDRYVDAWRGLVDLLGEGRLRAIGVSNFTPAHLERLRLETGTLPDVNQIELNPTAIRTVHRAYHRAHGIATQCWGPLGGRGAAVLREPAIIAIAERLGRTPAQVVLRWHIDLGLSAVPKSADPRRLAENLGCVDVVLGDDDLAAISALDRGEAGLLDPATFGH
jgi:2,5-diketo-D-gluconate reductase A